MNGQSSAYSQSVPSYLFGRSGGGSGSGGSGGSMYAAAPHHASQQHRRGDGGAHQHQGATTAAPVPATLSRPPPSATHVIDLLTTQQQGGGGGGSGGGSSRRFQQQSTVQSHRASVNKEGGRSIAETTTTTTDRHGGGVVGRGVAAAGNAGRYTAPLERQQQRQQPLIVELTSGGGDRSGGEGKDRLDDCRGAQPKRYRLETTTTKSNATPLVTVVATTTTASGCRSSADAAATLVRTAAVSDVERGRIGTVVSQQQQQSPAHTAGAVGGGWHSPLPMVGSVTVRVGSNLGNPFTHEKGADGQPLGAGGQPLRCGGSGGSPRGAAATASNAGGVPLSKARDAPRATTNIVDTTTAAKENALGSRYITPIPPASPSGAIRYPAQPPIVKVGGGGGANITKVVSHRSSALKLHSTIARTNASEAGGGVSPRPLTAPAHGGGAHIDLTLAGSTTQRAGVAQHPLPHAPSPIDGASPRSGEQSPSPISSGGYLGLSPKSTISEALRRVNYPHQPLIPASLLSAAVKPNTTPLPSWIQLLPPQTPREQQQQQPEDVCRRVVDTTISNTLTRYTAIKNDNHKRRRSPTPPRARASGVLAQSPGGCILVFDTSSLIRVVEAGKQLDGVLQRHRIYIPYITLDELDKKSKFLPNRHNNNNNNRAMTPTMRHCRAMRDWLTARMLEDETLQRTAATSKRYHDPAQTTPSSREPRIRIQRHSEIDPAYAYRELNNDDSILGYAVYLRNVRQVTAPIVFVTEDKILELKAMSEQFSAISVLKLLDGF